MRSATISKNGVEFGGDNPFELMKRFADPATETEMFHSGMMSLKDEGSFEFVLNNDVFVITMV